MVRNKSLAAQLANEFGSSPTMRSSTSFYYDYYQRRLTSANLHEKDSS